VLGLECGGSDAYSGIGANPAIGGAADLIVKQGFLSKDEFEQMLIGKDYWMDSRELCKRGIATHVILEGEEITAKEYLKILKKTKKSNKKKE